jgi:hypothetical protein
LTTLCEANRAAGSTRKIFLISLIIPISMGLVMWALASGAAPERELSENYLAMFGLAMTVLSIFMIPVAYAFKWNWEAKYYGSFIFPLATGSVLGICPALCIAIYGALSVFWSTIIMMLEVSAIFWWCRKIFKIYMKIHVSINLFSQIYVDKNERVHFLLQGDKAVLEKFMKFSVSPSAKMFILFAMLAFLTIPYAFLASKFAGVPYTHVFMAVGGVPLNLFFFGLCTKSWVVFYYFPKKITNETGKHVYVDMSSLPKK